VPRSRSKADNTAGFERSAGIRTQGYMLRLYIAGASSRSARAIKNIQKICEKHLAGQYQLEVVDLYQQPARAAEGQVLAAPTLVKEEPSPARRLVGDLSDEVRVLAGLGLDASGVVPGG
jgi:circadian clock protein KaiB